MEWITSPEAWIALATLTVLEIVLGIDNVVFIAIVAGRLPEEEQGKAWKVGLALACLTRLALLFSIVWIMRSHHSSLLRPRPRNLREGPHPSGGGIVPPLESHAEDPSQPGRSRGRSPRRALRMAEDLLGCAPGNRGPDIISSLDSVITAVGIVDQVAVMGHRHHSGGRGDDAGRGGNQRLRWCYRTVKMLALSFLGLYWHGPHGPGSWATHSQGYLYFAMGFSFFVELLNQRAGKARPVRSS